LSQLVNHRLLLAGGKYKTKTHLGSTLFPPLNVVEQLLARSAPTFLRSRELSEGQTKELILAGEFFDVAIALVAIDANLKLVGREEIHELREDGSAKIHSLPPEQARKQ